MLGAIKEINGGILQRSIQMIVLLSLIRSLETLMAFVVEFGRYFAKRFDIQVTSD